MADLQMGVIESRSEGKLCGTNPKRVLNGRQNSVVFHDDLLYIISSIERGDGSL